MAGDPFCHDFLDRLLTAAIDKYIYTKDDEDKTLIKRILNIYVPVFETVPFMEDIEHAEPLPFFSDMLKPEYLLPPVTDVIADEDDLDELLEAFYMEIPEELFFSFFYYTWAVLAFSLNKNMYRLIEINDLEINTLIAQLKDKRVRDYIDGIMYM